MGCCLRRRVEHERTKSGSGLCERVSRREATETEGFVINKFPIVYVCMYTKQPKVFQKPEFPRMPFKASIIQFRSHNYSRLRLIEPPRDQVVLTRLSG